MNEIKCPKCGEVFKVDDMGYAMLLKQVKDTEFSKELDELKEQFNQDKLHAVEKAIAETEKRFITNIALMETEIVKLKADVRSEKLLKKSEIKEIVTLSYCC